MGRSVGEHQSGSLMDIVCNVGVLGVSTLEYDGTALRCRGDADSLCRAAQPLFRELTSRPRELYRDLPGAAFRKSAEIPGRAPAA